jgi:hypothetical protein
VLPGGDGLLEDFGLDLTLERVIGADVSGICYGAIPMAEVLGESEETGSVSQRDEAREGLAALMSRESPRSALILW